MIVSAIQRLINIIGDRQHMTVYHDIVNQYTGKRYIRIEYYSYQLYSKTAQIELAKNNEIDFKV